MPVAMENSTSTANANTGKYMTFTLSGECYGIEISLLEEVIGELPVTPIPNTPSFIKGVINLRGRIVPVIDLRIKLRMKLVELGHESCILVLKIPVRNGVFNMGMIVEHVHDIRGVDAKQISEPPNFGVKVNTSFLNGVVKEGEKQAILLLNAVKALTTKEIEQVKKTTETDAK